MPDTYIAASGYYHPEGRLSNRDLESLVDTSEAWILKHTGIRERRRADEDTNTSDLAVKATERALERSTLEADRLDVLVCATSTPDHLAPATASYVCNKMKLRAVAFDVNASCSGFVYGLAVADGLLRTQGHEHVALCAAEKYTRVVDYEDRRFSIFWGDGAATLLMQRERPRVGAELVDLTLSSHNQGADLVVTPIKGFFNMDGAAVKPIATKLMVDSARELLDRHGLRSGDLRAFMGHQMNLRLLEDLTGILGISEAQHWHNVELAGNQGGAGIVTTLCAGLERESLVDGDLILLTVVGSGFTAGSALLRWIDSR